MLSMHIEIGSFNSEKGWSVPERVKFFSFEPFVVNIVSIVDALWLWASTVFNNKLISFLEDFCA